MTTLNSTMKANYDRVADTLYLSARPRVPAVSREGEEPGVYWRYDLQSGKLVGATILDFEEFWLPQLDQLIDALAEKFEISRAQASRVLKRVN